MARMAKREVWARRIAAYERSGLNRRAWCAANDVSVHTLDYWRRQLRTSSGRLPRTRQTLVPVMLRAAASRSASIELSIDVAFPDGVTLRVPATVDRDWLVGLLRELRAC